MGSNYLRIDYVFPAIDRAGAARSIEPVLDQGRWRMVARVAPGDLGGSGGVSALDVVHRHMDWLRKLSRPREEVVCSKARCLPKDGSSGRCQRASTAAASPDW